MNDYFRYFRQKDKKRQRGGVLPLVAISLILFISFAALTIDLGYLFVGRNELQNAADAAALGGARKLGKIYQEMAEAGQTITGYNVDNDEKDKEAIIAIAKEIASQNKATKEGVIIDETRVPSDIQIGVWDQDSEPKFTETDEHPNAVRITAHRDTDNVAKEISTFFAGIFGIDSAPVSAMATAALLGQGTSEPGELQLPIGLSRKWFDGPKEKWCGNVVKFSPPSDPDACAGWTGFDLGKATKNQLDPIISGEHEVPGTDIGDDFYYTNGVQVADVFTHLLVLYGTNGNDVDRIYQYDPDKNYDQQEIPQPVTYDYERKPLCIYNSPSLSVCNEADVEKDDVHLRYPNLDFDNMDGGSQQKNFTGPYRYAHEWETTMVVYDSDDCTPSQDMPIKGYVRVVLYDVGYPSNAYVYARVTCDFVSPEDTRGGGSNFGVLGPIPSLVE